MLQVRLLLGVGAKVRDRDALAGRSPCLYALDGDNEDDPCIQTLTLVRHLSLLSNVHGLMYTDNLFSSLLAQLAHTSTILPTFHALMPFSLCPSLVSSASGRRSPSPGRHG